MTALDTSTNYLGFRSHQVLARTAGDLLPEFAISTKIGYLRTPGGTRHSLDPVHLRAAAEQAVKDLGREPDLVFLHNPEHSLREAGPNQRAVLADACATLDGAATEGLCAAWGVASWDPAPLPNLIDAAGPLPSVLMVRAGLLVGMKTLESAEALARACALERDQVWGMSPFGGTGSAAVWHRFDPRVFLRDGRRFSRAQAAFRAAYHLPRVGTVAVGTDDPSHLRELAGALEGEIDDRAVQEYRRLLKERSRPQPA